MQCKKKDYASHTHFKYIYYHTSIHDLSTKEENIQNIIFNKFYFPRKSLSLSLSLSLLLRFIEREFMLLDKSLFTALCFDFDLNRMHYNKSIQNFVFEI